MKTRSFAILFFAYSFGAFSQGVFNNGATISISGAQLTVGQDLTNNGTIINNGNLLISGAWINNGTYDPGTGQITFNSPSVQIVNHNDQAFKRLTISGGGEKQFLANITIEDELVLTDGLLVSQNGARIIIQPGAVVSGGSDQSHIVGSVEIEGTGDWYFPVGNATEFLPVVVQGVSDANAKAVLTLHELAGETLVPTSPLVKLSSKRYWELALSSGNLSGTTMTLPMSNEDGLTSDLSLVVVAQSSGPSAAFENLGQSALSGDLALGDVTSADAPSKTFLAIGALSGDNSVRAFNGVSPNGDQKNDFFKILNIEKYPNNKVIVFNRWGDKVFEITGYDNKQRVFVGENNLGGGGKLPSGTYFYRIELESGVVTGYLELRY